MATKSAAVFFDRDNTLIINDGYLGDPLGVRLVMDAAQAVARAHGLGYAVVTVSNQSGVARGLFSEEAVMAVNARMAQLLLQVDPRATIDRHDFCPFHPQAKVERYRQNSDLRKPAPGMILRSAALLNLDLPRSWVVGDAPRDIEAGRAAGCRTVLIQSAGPAASPAAAPAPHSATVAVPDAIVKTLTEAMSFIAAQKNAPTPERAGGT